MDRIMDRVTEIFRTVFDDESLIINEETDADDIEGWDSLQHINLLAVIESEFDIKFDIDQIVSMENVGDIIKEISKLV